MMPLHAEYPLYKGIDALSDIEFLDTDFIPSQAITCFTKKLELFRKNTLDESESIALSS